MKRDDEPWLLKRAKECGRTPQEQRHLEIQAFRMGYKYYNIKVEENSHGNYVHRRFIDGQKLGRRILEIQGRLFA
jgi:hypothetical protein